MKRKNVSNLGFSINTVCYGTLQAQVCPCCAVMGALFTGTYCMVWNIAAPSINLALRQGVQLDTAAYKTGDLRFTISIGSKSRE